MKKPDELFMWIGLLLGLLIDAGIWWLMAPSFSGPVSSNVDQIGRQAGDFGLFLTVAVVILVLSYIGGAFIDARIEKKKEAAGETSI